MPFVAVDFGAAIQGAILTGEGSSQVQDLLVFGRYSCVDGFGDDWWYHDEAYRTAARGADEEIELELGLGICVDGVPRLPWRCVRSLVLVGFGHGPVLLRRLPVGGRVDKATSKQAPYTASALYPLLATSPKDRWLVTHFVPRKGTQHRRIVGKIVNDQIMSGVQTVRPGGVEH